MPLVAVLRQHNSSGKQHKQDQDRVSLCMLLAVLSKVRASESACPGSYEQATSICITGVQLRKTRAVL
jgi:hypothetical protein